MQPDLDPGTHAQRLEALRRTVRQPADLGEAVAPVEEIDEGPGGEARDRLVQQSRHRLDGDLRRPIHIVRVGFQPRIGRRVACRRLHHVPVLISLAR
jgi:hypothetical protein